MDPELHARATERLQEALELSPTERARFLDALADQDPEVHAELLSLLPHADRRPPALLDDEARAAAQSRTSTPTGPREGDRLADFELVRLLGRGGMGEVWAARQDRPRREVALKLLPPSHASPERLARFQREAEALGRLGHPGIAQVHAAGSVEFEGTSQPYIALELIDGPDLLTHAERRGLDVRARLELVAQVADALQHAHERGVVHRDLKPDNVLVTADGHAKVLDFGIARLDETASVPTSAMTQDGQLLGTFGYMAPEQLSLEVGAITPRTDVYSLGMVAYELLAGRLPHQIAGLPLTAAVRLLAETEAPLLGRLDRDLRGDVETVVAKALAKEPERRYRSMADLAADLRRHLDHQPVLARRPSAVYRARKFVRRHRPLVAASLSIFAAVVTTLALYARAESRRVEQVERSNLELERLAARTDASIYQGVDLALLQGRPWIASSQLLSIPRARRGVPWRLLARELPRVLDLSDLDLAGQPSDLRWLPDGRLVGRTASGTLGVWDPDREGEPERPFPELELRRVALDAEGWTVGAVDLGGQLVVLDLAAGAYARWGEVPDTTESIHVAPDGVTVLVQAERDLGVHRNGALLAHHAPPGDDTWWRPLAVFRESRALVTSNARESTLAYVDLATGDLTVARAFVGFTSVIAEDPAGSTIAHAFILPSDLDDRSWIHPKLLDPADLSVRSVLPGRDHGDGRTEWIREFDFTPDGRRLFAGYTDGLRGWDLATGQVVIDVKRRQKYGFLSAARVSPDGTRVLATSPVGERPWLHSVGARPAWIERVESGSAAGSSALRPSATIEHGNWVYQLALSPDGELGASAAPLADAIQLWSVRDGRLLARFERPSRPSNMTSLLAFDASGDGLLFTEVDAAGTHLRRWDLETGAVTALGTQAEAGRYDLELVVEPFTAALGTDASRRVDSRVQRSASGWIAHGPIEDPEPLVLRSPDGEHWTDRVVEAAQSVDFSPDGRHLAVGTSDGVAIVELTTPPRVVRELELDAFVARVHAVAYSPDGAFLAVGTSDGYVHLFETRFHQRLHGFGAHRSSPVDALNYCFALAWTGDGERLVSAGGDGRVCVWDVVPEEQREREAAAFDEQLERARSGAVDASPAAARIARIETWASL